MMLKERTYSVLVVSAGERLNAALDALLPEAHGGMVRVAHSVSAAKRAWSESAFDFVIVNSPLPDDPGLRFAVDVSSSKYTAVLLLVRAELHEEIFARVVEQGVFTLPKPLNRPTLLLALRWLATARERLRKLGKKDMTVEEKMQELRLINRAKWLLMTEGQMDEPQAHRYIEKQAMDRAITRKQVAEEIIHKYS